MMTTKKCGFCGKEFTTSNVLKKYCSSSCCKEHNKISNNKLYWDKKNKGGDPYKDVYESCCFVCGGGLPAGKTIHRGCLSETKFDIDEEFIY